MFVIFLMDHVWFTMFSYELFVICWQYCLFQVEQLIFVEIYEFKLF